MKKRIVTLLCFLTVFSYSQSTKYYRQLRYNHVSPFIPIVGIHPIDSTIAKETSHYVFSYDSLNRLKTIINNHYHTEKVHPLASLGVYKTVFNYEKGKETRIFYDVKDKRMKNDRKVYKEVYLFDKSGFKSQLNFYDVNDVAMESNWRISEYRWEKNKEFIIERRYNLNGEFKNLSPYFEFGITGMKFHKDGAPKGNYNLNEDLEITNNSVGVASYQDKYDSLGNHTVYGYYDSEAKLVRNQWGYAKGKKYYDAQGNYIKRELLNVNNKIIQSRSIYSNSSIVLSEIASSKDSTAIIKCAANYLKALQKLNPKLMDTILNPNLNKATVGYDRNSKKQYAKLTSKDKMIQFAKHWNASGARFPFKPNHTIEILDIYDQIATVKLVSDTWVEYLQFIKLDTEWSIINLLWQYKDLKRYGN